MSDALILLIIRVLTSVTLFAFIGAIGWMIWQDFRLAERMMNEQNRQRGRLMIIDSPDGSIYNIGESFPLLPLTTIGRSSTNIVHLNEPFISNEHALIAWRNGQWWLEDLNSSNGTRLNTNRIQEPTVLSATDEISFGAIKVRVELE